MPTIAEIRQQYPQYSDMSDDQLADSLHAKFYADMPRETFNAKIGMKTSSVRDNTHDVAKEFLRGVPILGAGIDQAGAAISAAANPITGVGQPGETFAERYANNLEAEKRASSNFQRGNPGVSTVANFLGGAASFAPAGAIPSVARALGIGGGALLPNVVRGGISGAAIGSADAIARGHDPMVGGGAGFMAGVGGPLAGRAVGAAVESGVNAARNFMRPSGNVAAEKVAEAAARDAIDLPQARSSLNEMGPNAMIADLGPNLQRQAGAIAATPGEGQKIIRSALDERKNYATARTTEAINKVLGKPVDSFDAADTWIRHRAANAKPAYENAYNAGDKAIWSKTLERISSSPSILRAMRGAVNAWSDRAIADGFGAMNPGALVDNGGILKFLGGKVPVFPNLQFWDYTKRILDDEVRSAFRAGKNQKGETLSTLSRMLRGELDKIVPEYDAARQAYAGPSAIIDALDEGQKVFSNTVTPRQLRNQLAKMTEGEKEAFLQGSRGVLANMMGTARNDALKVRGEFQKGFNREKLAILIGPSQAREFLRSLRREAAFSSTRNIVTQNSETAARQAARADVQNMRPEISPEDAFALGGVRGVVRTQAMRFVTNALNGLRNGDQASVERSMAQILSATGPERDAALKQLFDTSRQIDPTGQLANRVSSAVALGLRSIQSGVQPALP